MLFENYDPNLFNAPTTEVAFAKLRGEEHREAWDGAIGRIVERLPTFSTVKSAAWAKALEDDDVYILVVGWDSLQVRLICVSENELKMKRIGH